MSKYKFIAGCPACGSRNRDLWHHQDCSSYEEIDENGWIYCLGCNQNLGFIMDLTYNCGYHDFQSCQDATAVFQALAMMTDAQKDIPKDFADKISARILQRLLKN
jgi:hypothetical protein